MLFIYLFTLRLIFSSIPHLSSLLPSLLFVSLPSPSLSLFLSAYVRLVYDLCVLRCLHLCLSLKMKSRSSSIQFFGGESILHVRCTTAKSFLVCTNILAVTLQGFDDDDDGVCVTQGLLHGHHC